MRASSGRSDGDGAGPRGAFHIELAAGREDARADAFAGAYLVAPRQHVIAQIAAHLAHAYDAIDEEQLKQRGVLFDQRLVPVNRIAAQVHVHVPQPRDEIEALAVDSLGPRRNGHRFSRAHRRDSAAVDQHRLSRYDLAAGDVNDVDSDDGDTRVHALGE